jgi:hypothetical protein
MGDNEIDDARRFSARVEELPSLQTEDFRAVPVPFSILNFSNWYPLNDPRLQVLLAPVPHPTHWPRVQNVDAWNNLRIGAALFVCYRGPQNDGWRHGYFLVHKH